MTEAKKIEGWIRKFRKEKAPVEKPELIVPFHERIVSSFRISPWLSWLLMGELLGGGAYLAVLFSGGTMKWIGQLAMMYAIVFMIMGSGPIWIKKQLESLLPAMNNFVRLPTDKITLWLKNELKRVFEIKGMLLTGLCVAFLAMWSFIYQTKWYVAPEVWWGTDVGNWAVTIVVFILAILGGMALYILVNIAWMIHRISKLPLEMTIYQHPTTSISAIGTVLQRLSILVAIAYGLISLTAVPLSPFRNKVGWVLIGWLVFAGIVVIIFFIFPQYRIHIAMKNAKADKIRMFSRHISKALEKAIKKPSSDQIAYVKELFDLYKYLLDMPEWPFNTKSLISLVSVIILPILLSVLQHVLSQ